MTTYSTVLRLELPGDGQQVGTWGQTTNRNLGTLLEQAITGVRYITMIDANYTLTNLNGTSDEARNAVIVAQGTNLAIRKIIIPLNEKLYTISNQTTGGYAIQVGASTGNYVTIPNGTTTLVYCDGTNTIVGINGIAGAFNVSGALTIGGDATVVGNTSLGGTLGVTGAASFSNTVGFAVGPTAPTASPGTNTTQLATTAFTTTAVNAGLGTLGTMSTQNANAVAITGGAINGTTIGASTPSTVAGTTITASSSFSGPGTGLTGTASGLSIGGNAATATNSTNSTNATTVTGATQNNITSIPNLATVGTITSGTWSGSFGAVSGANLTNLNASNLASGTVPSARLTGTYAISISGNAATATSATTATNATNATNATTAATATNALAFQGKTKLGLGITGEVWNNVAGSRVQSTNITNPYSYPIMVSVGTPQTFPQHQIVAYVNGVQVANTGAGANNYTSTQNCSFIVPSGAVYRVEATGSGGIGFWAELY